MQRLLLSKVQGRKDFWKNVYINYAIGIILRWKKINYMYMLDIDILRNS